MSRTKFGSDTMLNISIDVYTMLYILEWMWKMKHRIGTREHESNVVQLCWFTSMEETLKSYIFII